MHKNGLRSRVTAMCPRVGLGVGVGVRIEKDCQFFSKQKFLDQPLIGSKD